MAQLDKFYTKSHIAKQCLDFLYEKIPSVKNMNFVEPSAGNGSFSSLVPSCIALDIKPEGPNIQEQDFFKFSPNGSNYVTFGNPPFGKRSKMAIDFFNHAASFSEIIAFIVPVSFMKWGVQKELANEWHLYDYFYLEENSFTDKNKDFSVRCVFQIWTKKDLGQNKRLLKSPPISHPDFELWQYNATDQAFGYIDKDWEFAVYRQGYKDYTRIFTRKDYEEIKEMMLNNIQFFFIKPKTAEAKDFIFNIDFTALAERNTATPGFGKADFISYYLENKK
jgi:hypothetical protein